MRKEVSVSILLALLSFALFLPTLGHGFILLDDQIYVTENPHVRNGLRLENMAWAFTSFDACNWHPLTWILHMVDCQLVGLAPWGHHLTNLLLHASNTVLLFLFLRSATGALWKSAVVAGLFGLHPMHVESVAWIAERKDLLSTLFWLLTLSAYVAYARKPQSRAYLITVLLYVLALLSKPMVVTLPFVMLMMDFWPLQRFSFSKTSASGKVGKPSAPTLNFKRVLLEKIPFFILTVASCMITVAAQKQGGAVATFTQIPLAMRLANLPAAYLGYVSKLLWPADLCIYYPLTGQTPAAEMILGCVLIAGITTFAWLVRKTLPPLIFGWFYFLGTLVPVIGILQVGGQAMADRYTYIPSIGFLVSIVWGMAWLEGRFASVKKPILGLAISSLIICGALTFNQIGYWKSSVVLFQHAVQVTRENAEAHTLLGDALLHSGNLDEGLLELQEASRLRPEAAEIHGRLAQVLSAMGKTTEAIDQSHLALSLNPDSLEVLNNLAWMLATSGDAAIRNGAEAVKLSLHACELTHYKTPVYIGTLAAAYAEIGDFAEAIKSAALAHDLCKSQGLEELAKQNLELLESYKQGRAYHETK